MRPCRAHHKKRGDRHKRSPPFCWPGLAFRPSLERLWTWCDVRGRWQLRQAQLGLIAGQGHQKSHQFGVFIGSEFVPQLQATHHVHRFRQGRCFAIVEVGIGQCHVAQSRHFEVKTISILTRDHRATIGGVAFVRLHNAHLLEGVAAHGGPLWQAIQPASLNNW